MVSVPSPWNIMLQHEAEQQSVHLSFPNDKQYNIEMSQKAASPASIPYRIVWAPLPL